MRQQSIEPPHSAPPITFPDAPQLSWAYYEFKDGYTRGQIQDMGAATVRWGADYLMKASATNITTASGSTDVFVAQVGCTGRACGRRAGSC